jgi:hypothetical protein
MKISRLLIVGSFLFLFSCVKEDHFGKSNRGEIKSFLIPGQSGSSIINNDSLTVVVTMPESTTDFMLTPSQISLSNFATVKPAAGTLQDFSSPVQYTVTAEDGSVHVYTVSVQRGGSQPQLANSSFEDWYIETVLGKALDQPGVDKNTTIWGTANRGLALGGSNGNSTKETKGDSSYIQLSDPRSNITLGTAFSGKPLTFSFSYTYQPGASNEDANGQPLTYGDQCDIYLFLENRDGAQVKRVATAWFRTGDNVASWTRETVPVKYGPLAASDPWFGYAQPQTGEIWGDGTEVVTHITVLATSSFEGDFFKGAIGSTLALDNIDLGY